MVAFIFSLLLVGIGLLLLRLRMAVAARVRDEEVVRGATLAMTIVAAALILLGVTILVFSTVEVVPPGHRGVVVTIGSVSPSALDPGLHFVLPWSDVTLIDCRVQKKEQVQEAETRDTQTVKVQLMLNWHPDPAYVVQVYSEVGPDFAGKLIPLAEQECLKAEVAKYDVTDLISQRHVIKAAVDQALRDWLSGRGIAVDAVAVGDVDFSDAYDASIEAKQAAVQRSLQAQNEVQQAQAEAEKAVAKATGEADSAIQSARGEAESLRLRGTAQAEYNQRVAESLTPPLLQKIWLERWSGSLPQTMLSDGTSLSMLMPFRQP